MMFACHPLLCPTCERLGRLATCETEKSARNSHSKREEDSFVNRKSGKVFTELGVVELDNWKIERNNS